MGWTHSMHEAIDRLAEVPGLRTMTRKDYLQRFLANAEDNLFLGLYDSFEEAVAHAPRSKPLGYDNEGAAALPYLSRVYAHDYPALFWLGRSFSEGMDRVFDLGGHIGIKYYAFRRMIDYPASLAWTVCDVPAVVARGAELAAARDRQHSLHFTRQSLDASGCDVLYASGSLQYLPVELDELLDSLPHKPRRIIVNLTPIHPTRTFFTVNSIGPAFCPYRVQAREPFLAAVLRCGYEKRDEWENAGKSLSIPFERDCDVPA